MLNVIVFSFNRGSQLDLLLRSMKKYFKEFSSYQIKILYKYSNDFFEKGYNKLKEIHNDENLLYCNEVENFQSHLIYLFDVKQKYTIFFVDDNIFKEPFSIEDEQFKYFESHGDIVSLSLRLHPRLIYCYPANIHMIPPQFIENNVFNWRGQRGDYGYPMSLDGHIFRSMEIYYYLLNYRYDGPNSLESQMALNPLPVPKMMCYDKSIIMNNPINKVQTYNDNVHGNISPEFLNEQFLNDKIIDLKPFEGFENFSCHQELPVTFI